MPLELTCRVSSADSLTAAVRAGADALCLTAASYGQVKEGIFGPELCEAVKYCRARGKKVSVVFSAFASDDDLLKLKGVVTDALRLGADGFFAQDAGLVKMIKKLSPDARVFGGEGMAAHSIADCMAAESLGLSGVTLAKELDLSQIKNICSKTGLKTFVFAHGDTCVSYDGKCFMSSSLCSRSALRGECSYPCRALYSYFGDAPGYHLSLKDTCLLNDLPALAGAGVKSVYINASGKRPEYAAMLCGLYAKALIDGKTPPRPDVMKIESAFSREGMTDAYLKGEKGAFMFGMHNEGSDKEIKKTLAAVKREYVTEPEKPSLPVDLYFYAHANERTRLFGRDGDGNEFEAYGPAPLFAKKGASEQDIRAFFGSRDRSVFYARDVKVDIGPGLKINAAALAALKKAVFDGLISRRTAVNVSEPAEWQPGVRRLPKRKTPAYTMSFLKTAQITPEILDLAPEIVYLPLWRILEDTKIAEILRKRDITLCAALDRIIFDREWTETLEALRELKKRGVTDVLCQSAGQIKLLSGLGFTLRGDFALNVFNSQTVKALRAESLSSCALSFDMSLEKIKAVSPAIDTEIAVYGRLPLLVSENCLIHKRNGVHSCHNGAVTLIDRTGRSYPLLPEKGCRTVLYSAEKLWLADKTRELAKTGASFLRLCFTTENSKECLNVAEAYYGKPLNAPERATRGVYFHGAY
ncbi:MAG: U32 family peptidase [Clostridia bacterium]|nr:U32 family peptidase [Clostridia bacterium]